MPHPSSLPLEGSAVLNDTPVACQIRGPTDPQGDRCPHIQAASAATYPLRCFAPQWARFDNRHSTSAPTPTLTAVSGSGARGTSDPPNRQCYPLHFMRECIPPNLHDPQRAKGSLNRRFEWFSLVTFFLQKKKVTRAGARNSPACARRCNTCSPLSAFPHVTGVFLIVVVLPTVPAQLSAAAACYYGKNYSFCRVAG